MNRTSPGYANEADMLISLRADRYFTGLCVSCGKEDATEPLHPIMEGALTHCRGCAAVELRMRERAARRPEPPPSCFLFMLVK